MKELFDNFSKRDLENIGLNQYCFGPEEEQLKIVNDFAWEIENFFEPSENVQLMAMNKNPNIIQCIKNPTKNVIILSIKKDSFYCKNDWIDLSEDLQLEAVKKIPLIFAIFIILQKKCRNFV